MQPCQTTLLKNVLWSLRLKLVIKKNKNNVELDILNEHSILPEYSLTKSTGKTDGEFGQQCLPSYQSPELSPELGP